MPGLVLRSLGEGGRGESVRFRIGLATAHHRAGQPNLATEHAKAALAIARRAHFRVLEANALAVLAEMP